MKTLLFAAALSLIPVSDSGIVVRGDVVTMPLRTFKSIVILVQEQKAAIDELQKQVDEDNQQSADIESCVRKNASDNHAVTTCFGDKEI